jgi:hypothetical protein
MYRITIFDNEGRTADRYTVIINNEIYYMSFYPDRHNEVCILISDNVIERLECLNDLKLEKRLNKIPKNLKYQIRKIILEDKRGF